VISNGVATAANVNARQRQALREDLGLADKRRYLVNVARQHPIKDHATLLKAYYHVSRNYGDVDLLLVGDGPLRRDLHELAVTLGIKERVHFLGVRNDVPNLLRLADAFVLTSLSEAASLTILEAMAASLPVVVTAVGGNPEIVRHGVEGLLVPPGDSVRLAEALHLLLSGTGRATAMGRAGAERVRKYYQLEHTVLQYRALYGRLTRSA
jgi:glycosyltransferase involved in cell wall biosynthesis